MLATFSLEKIPRPRDEETNALAGSPIVNVLVGLNYKESMTLAMACSTK